jgi:hypothetical protein
MHRLGSRRFARLLFSDIITASGDDSFEFATMELLLFAFLGRRDVLSIPFTQRIFVPAHILIRQVNNESVLLNLQNQSYFGLDEVGTRMWMTLTTADSIQAAYDVLVKEYDVDAEQLKQNLQDLIAKLVEHGLIEISNG